MDPNTARARMIESANLTLALASDEGESYFKLADAAIALAEAVHNLDEWLRAGGFLPDVWIPLLGRPSQPGRKQDVDTSPNRCGVQYQEGPGGYLLPCEKLRGHSGAHGEPSKAVDDEKPPTDTNTVCTWKIWNAEVGSSLICGLDRGHDGPHA